MPSAATGGLDGFTALLEQWNLTSGARTPVDTVAMTPLAAAPGQVQGTRTMDSTGTFLVTMQLNSAAIPGGTYNLTVYPGPPNATQSSMQVGSICWTKSLVLLGCGLGDLGTLEVLS